MADEINTGTEFWKWRMSPLAWRLLILLFVLALLVFDATRPPSPESWSWVWIGKKLWKMPGGIGALIGALIGFGGLMYMTSKGYENLITAQEHQAHLSRQAELDRIEWEMQCLAVGLRGELESVAAHCQFQTAHIRKRAEKMASVTGRAKKTPMEYDPAPILEFAFFKANAGRLGILGGKLAGDLSRIFETFAIWRRIAENAAAISPELQAKQLLVAADTLEGNIPTIIDMIDRLKAVERGETDPGLLEKLKTVN